MEEDPSGELIWPEDWEQSMKEEQVESRERGKWGNTGWKAEEFFMWWVSYRLLGVEVAIGVTPKYPVFIPLFAFPTTSIISSASDFIMKREPGIRSDPRRSEY